MLKRSNNILKEATAFLPAAKVGFGDADSEVGEGGAEELSEEGPLGVFGGRLVGGSEDTVPDVDVGELEGASEGALDGLSEG